MAAPLATTLRQEEQVSLEADFLAPKLVYASPPDTYGDIKTALARFEIFSTIVSTIRDPALFARRLPDDFPLHAGVTEVISRWYNDLTGRRTLHHAGPLIVQLSSTRIKELPGSDDTLLQAELMLLSPPGLTAVLLEYDIRDFQLKAGATPLKPRSPDARYELVLSDSSASTPVILEFLLPASIKTQSELAIDIIGQASLTLLSQTRKIDAAVMPPQSLRQLQRFLRTGRRPLAARYGDFEIRWKSIDRNADNSASVTFELHYQERPYLFESHMTPPLEGRTTLTFQTPGTSAIEIVCERTSIDGQLQTLDIVEQSVGPLEWEVPLSALQIEIAPHLKRIPIAISLQAPFSR